MDFLPEVRTRESSRGRCVPRAKYQEGREREEGRVRKKKKEKCEQDQRASPCSTSRCRDGPGSISLAVGHHLRVRKFTQR